MNWPAAFFLSLVILTFASCTTYMNASRLAYRYNCAETPQP